MARRRPDATDSVTKNDLFPPKPLPQDPPAFARLVAELKLEDHRYALYWAIAGELRGQSKVYASRKRPAIARTKDGRVYESRLLALTRVPAFHAMYGGLQPSHFQAWSDLVHLRSPEFAARLRGWLRSKESEFGCAAAEHLAWMGLKSDMPRMFRMLGTARWKVRGFVAEGLARACLHGHVDAGTARRCFDALTKMVCGEVKVPRTIEADEVLYKLPEHLRHVDERRALALLRSPRALHQRNPAIRSIMLHHSSVQRDEPHLHRPLDPELVWPIFDAVRTGEFKLVPRSYFKDGGRDQVLGMLLGFAGEGDPVRTKQECRRILDDPKSDDALRRDAREALKRCKGVPDPDAVLSVFWRKPGAFGPRATKVLRVLEMVDHCLRDGLPLYFANLGEHWRVAAAGLEMLGCAGALKVLKESGRLVESFGSMKNRRAVIDTTGGMDAAADAKLERFGDRMDGHLSAIRAAAEREMGRNPGDYRRR